MVAGVVDGAEEEGEGEEKIEATLVDFCVVILPILED